MSSFPREMFYSIIYKARAAVLAFMFKTKDYSECKVFQYSSQVKMQAESVLKTPISRTLLPYSSRPDRRERYFGNFICGEESTIEV